MMQRPRIAATVTRRVASWKSRSVIKRKRCGHHGQGGATTQVGISSLTSVEESKKSLLNHGSLVAGAASVVAAAATCLADSQTQAVQCESSAAPSSSVINDNTNREQNDKDDNDDDLPPNPLWPSGVPDDMVNEFVDSVLQDPKINIRAIPDVIEREIYISCVKLTLNAVYETVGSFHGMDFFGHTIELQRERKHHDTSSSEKEKDIESMRTPSNESNGHHLSYGVGSIDEDALEAVADRLLANKAVNQPLIPDIVERQLYINCLKLVFRLLDAIAGTLAIHMCNHDVKIHFEPATDQSTRDWIQDRLQQRAEETSARLSEVDLQAVERYAREVGAAPPDRDLGLIARLLDYGQTELIVQLNKTLYALILGILDDLLEDTVLTFLSDRIKLDVVCKKKEKGKNTFGNSETLENHPNESDKCKQGKQPLTPSLVSFTFGVGVGAALTAAATWKR